MKNITQIIKITLLAVVLSFGVSYVYAWNVPTATPPNANVSAPINTGSSYQIKTGWLKIIGANGADLASRLGLGNNWWMSENPNGWYALRQSGVGDRVTVDTGGNVGIGTSNTLASKLSVNGGVQVGVDVATCVAAKAGTLRWSGGKLEVCTGSIWKVVGSATVWDCSWGAVSNQRYNTITFCPSAGMWCGSGLTMPTCVSSWTHISDCWGWEYISDCKAN